MFVHKMAYRKGDFDKMIRKVKIDNLGTIDSLAFDGFQNVNLIIG